MSNGDYWKAVKASDSARGYRCNISYIDVNIPHQVINTIIIPKTIAYPYRGYIYFDVRE